MNANKTFEGLPAVVRDYIEMVIRSMRYRKTIRKEVFEELVAHFDDALRGLTEVEKREEAALRLVGEFGDAVLMGKLIRRGKIRCRPWWRTAIVRCLQVMAAMLLIAIVYLVWFFTGHPTVRVDYIALLNDKVRPKISETDNAWPHYEKAISSYVEMPESMIQIKGKYRQIDPANQAIIKEWIQQNDAAWQEVVAAVGKPYCFRPYAVGENDKQGMMLGILLPHLTEIKNLAKLGSWRSQVEFDTGKTDAAIDTSIAVIRSGKQWLTQVTLIEYLVGTAMVTIGQEQLLDIMSVRPPDKAGLVEIGQRLDQIWKGGYPPLTFEYEQMTFMDVVQHSFTEGGPGGGHLMPIMISYLYDEDRIPPIMACSMSLVHAGRDETVRVGTSIYKAMEDTIVYSPYQRKAKQIQGSDAIVENLPKYRYSLFHSMIPAFVKVIDRYYEGKTLMEATGTIIAIQRYKAENNNWPENLGELKTAGLISAIPMDPYGDGSLVYQRRGDGFVLYSRGTDMEDDGGKAVVDDPWGRRGSGQSDSTGPDGDRVFWPL